MLPFNRVTFTGFALFTATCLFAAWNFKAQREVTAWVDHSDRIIQQSQRVLLLFVDAETGQRGFLFTGAERYLDPYNRACASFREQLSELRRLTRDNPGQQTRLTRLDAFAAVKMAELARTVQLIRSHQSETAREVVLEGSGERAMAGIRSVLAEVAAEESALSAERVRSRNRNSFNLALGVAGSSFLGLVFLSFATRQQRRLAAERWLAQQSKYELTLLQEMVGRAPMGIVMLDRRLRQIQMSDSWLRDVGLTREAVLGRNHYDCFPNLPESWKDFHRRGLAGEDLSGLDDRFIAPDGTEHWVNWRIAPWGDSGESTGGIIIYSEDITRRKSAETSALQNELQYRGLFESMPDSVAYGQVAFQDGQATDVTFLAVNAAFHVLTGVADVAGRKLTDIFPAADPALIQLYRRVVSTRVPETFEYFSERLRKWLYHSLFSPQPGFFVVIVQDITARKEADLTARQWLHAFEESKSGIALASAVTGRLTAVNAAYSRGLGYSVGELIGQPIEKLYPESELGRRREVLGTAEAGRNHLLFETRHIRKDGSSFPVLVDMTIIRDDTGRPIYHIKIVHDLTELKRTSEALHASEARAQSLFENASQGILTVDSEGCIVDANTMVHQLFGYSSAELIGVAVDRLLPGDFRASRVIRLPDGNGGPEAPRIGHGLDLTARRKDGSEFPVEISFSHVSGPNGGLSIAFISDITERKRADAALRESEAQFRTLANAIPHLCWVANYDGYLSWYNQRWYDYTGTTIEQMEGWGWQAVHDQTLLPGIVQRWTASIASGAEFEMIFPLRAADGSFRPFLTRGTPVRNSAGQVIRWFGTNTDISAQLDAEEVLRSRTEQLESANDDLKRTSEALRTSEARARSLFENASQGILTADAEGRIVDVNAMVQRLFGYSASELIGSPVEILLPQHLPRRQVGQRSGYEVPPRAGLIGQDMDLVARRKDGTQFPVEISLSYVAEHQQGLSVAFISDITFRKEADRERETLIARLRDALAEKTVLLQEVHHRVKNNLAIIAALLGMQASTIQDGRARVALGESEQRVMSMARIHEFLYSTKHLDRVAFGQYLEQLANELFASYSVDASRVRLRVNVEEIELPVHQAIPCGLILNELLTNVLKYAFPDGRPGEITLCFERSRTGELCLSCSDNGVGIPPDFEWQKAKSLGLRIIRILARQIDGKLVLERDQGTKFELRFPPAPTESAPVGEELANQEV